MKYPRDNLLEGSIFMAAVFLTASQKINIKRKYCAGLLAFSSLPLDYEMRRAACWNVEKYHEMGNAVSNNTK